MPSSLSLAAVPLLIALNAFFVVSEYALVAVRPAQVQTMRARGSARAASAMARLKADPASAIGAIQVCITMSNLLLGWIGEPAMSDLLHQLFGPLIRMYPLFFDSAATVLSFIVVTLLTVVFSELLPKAMTLQYVETAARVTALPVLATLAAVRPLVWVMNRTANLVTVPLGLGRVEKFENQRMTVDELKVMAQQAAADGVLTGRERSIILNSLALGRRQAKEIMVPRVRVAYLDLQRSMEENRKVVEAQLFTRVPLCNGGLDHTVGIVHTKEFLLAYQADGDTSVLQLIARPAAYAPELVRLDRLLTTFREQRSEMVLLVDEYGGVEGIVTLQDVIDELLGEVAEEPGRTEAPA